MVLLKFLSLDNDIFFTILIAQFWVGIIQLGLALIQTLTRLASKKPIGNLDTYWRLVGIYFVGQAALYIFVVIVGSALLPLAVAWFLSAWAIAIYYIVKGWR